MTTFKWFQIIIVLLTLIIYYDDIVEQKTTIRAIHQSNIFSRFLTFKKFLLNKRVAIHFWVNFWALYRSPKWVLLLFLASQQPKVEDHCFGAQFLQFCLWFDWYVKMWIFKQIITKKLVYLTCRPTATKTKEIIAKVDKIKIPKIL